MRRAALSDAPVPRPGAGPELLIRGARPRVIVLSHANHRNFGDRLGWHVVNEVLPAHCNVVHRFLRPFTARPDEPCDLLVVGIGQSLHSLFLTDELLRFVERAPKVVGIFGTQYRDAIDAQRLGVVAGRCSIWFARHRADIEMFGAGTSAVHLGDWLVSQFPLTEWSRDERLVLGRLGNKVGGLLWHAPLDRLIQRIQSYREVFSPRVHPLLCALGSAERVAYREQRSSDGSGRVSGKFGSLLVDVFGRSFPENESFEVDRDAVAAYKVSVQRGMTDMRARLAEIVG